MNFDALGLDEALLRAVRARGYQTPTPIQRQAIPVVLAGDDLLAAAQTGTGKTAGFTLPLLQLLSAQPRRREPRCLVLVPTRELAAQVAESVTLYGAHLPLRSAVVFGGVNIKPQISKLRTGVDILVATPGRLLDLHGQGAVDLSHISILVLDEADRMLDMGFIHDLRRILALIPAKRQNLLFSATFTPDVRRLAGTFLHDPVSVDVSPAATAAETVEQRMVRVEKEHKAELLSHLIREGRWQQVLIFTRTKHGANRLAKRLDKDGIESLAIHGNKSQAARTKALAQFKAGELRALVATDLAARGLDIQQLPRVINYELPNVPEDYVHRIGRTGRAGLTGQALSLVGTDELKYLRDIEKLLGERLQVDTVSGFEPTVPEPEDDRPPLIRGRQGGRSAVPRPEGRSTRSERGTEEGRPPRGSRDPEEGRPDRPAAAPRPAQGERGVTTRGAGRPSATSGGERAGGGRGEGGRAGTPPREPNDVSLSWKDHRGRRRAPGEVSPAGTRSGREGQAGGGRADSRSTPSRDRGGAGGRAPGEGDRFRPGRPGGQSGPGDRNPGGGPGRKRGGRGGSPRGGSQSR